MAERLLAPSGRVVRGDENHWHGAAGLNAASNSRPVIPGSRQSLTRHVASRPDPAARRASADAKATQCASPTDVEQTPQRLTHAVVVVDDDDSAGVGEVAATERGGCRVD